MTIWYGRLQEGALARGIYLAPSGWEVGFLNGAMSGEDVGRLGEELMGLLRGEG